MPTSCLHARTATANPVAALQAMSAPRPTRERLPPFTYPRPYVTYGRPSLAYPRPYVTYGRPSLAYPRPYVTYGRSPLAYRRQYVTYGRSSWTYGRPSVPYGRSPAILPPIRALHFPTEITHFQTIDMARCR